MYTNEEESQGTKEGLNFEAIEVEEVNPHYFNNTLITPPYQLYRFNTGSGRIYFRFRDEENHRDPILYMGTGSVTKQMPTPKKLSEYQAEMGWNASQYEYNMWALYGSFSDSRIAEFIKNGRFENGLNGLTEQLKEYFYIQKFPVYESYMSMMSNAIKKDMIGLERFILDRNVEFVFIEYPVISEIDAMATPIDFGAFFDIEENKVEDNPRKGKNIIRVFGLVNYKSGRIYANHGIQCMAERNMFKEQHPEFTDYPIRSFNLTIKDFKSTNWKQYRPTSDYSKPYQLKDWTDVALEDDFRDYHSLARRKFEKRLERKITIIGGDMKMGDEPEQFVVSKTILEIINDGSWQKYSKSNAGVPQEMLAS